MEGESAEIRLARVQDAAAIAELSRDAIEAGLGWAWRPQRVAQCIRDPQTLCIVAGNRPIHGFCITQFGDELAHLSLLAVDLRTRRRGLGARLVNWTLAAARAAGIAAVNVEMRASNTAAHGFYRSLGFEMAGLVHGYYRGRESAQRMVLRLRPANLVPATWEIPVAWRGAERTPGDSDA